MGYSSERILSADAALLSTLRRQSYRGHVHSVFERSVNVEDARGELLAIAARDIDDAPGTLVADVPRFANDRVRAGDVATVCPNARVFRLGSYGFRLDGARAWDATLPRYPADGKALRRNVASVRACVDDAYAQSFADNGTQASTVARAGALLDRRAAALAAALSRHDLPAAVSAGRAMLGLGPGLTPTADDVLVGLFAVLHIPANPCGGLERVCRLIVADIDQHTSRISAAALEAAARGRVRESIVVLLSALIDAHGEGLPCALSRVLAIGSTSGAAIARGIIVGFDLMLQSAPDRTGTSPCTTLSNCRVG